MANDALGRQGFMVQRDNALASGLTTASSVKSVDAQDVVIPAQPARANESTGDVAIVGTWASDNPLDVVVQINDQAGTQRRVSSELQTVGNGRIEGLTVDNTVDIQTIRLRLIDTGIDTERATAFFETIPIEVTDAYIGDSGNNIRIEVDTSAIVVSAPIASTPEETSIDQDLFEGRGWEFGNVYPLSTSGLLHPDSERIAFDPEANIVYRRYLERDGGKTLVRLTPPLAEPLEQDSPIYQVTGDYTVKVIYDDGVPANLIEETYSGKTVFDIVSLFLKSALIQPSTQLLKNRRPGGIAALDVNLRTAQQLISVAYDGQAAWPGQLSAFTLKALETELITIKCINSATGFNQELWSVKGTVSGDLGNATTGTAKVTTPIDFTIPAIDSDPPVASERPRVVNPSYANGGKVNTAGEGEEDNFVTGKGPDICVYKWAFYENVVSTTLTFEYIVPQGGGDTDGVTCQCENGTTEGTLEGAVDDEQEGGPVTLTEPAKSKVKGVTAWVYDFSQADVLFYTGGLTGAGNWFVDGAVASRMVRDIGRLISRAYIRIYTEVTDGTLQTAAIAELDVVFSNIQSKISATTLEGGANAQDTELAGASYIAIVLDHIRDGINDAYVAGGLNPFDDAVNTDADGDILDGPYWRVTDSDGNLYEPMPYVTSANPTGKPYYSRRRRFDANGNGSVYNTREWGFIFVGDCLEQLVAGDTFEVPIKAQGQRVGYNEGDTIKVRTLGSRDLPLQGGVDGDDTYTWAVISEDSENRPDYPVVNGAEQSYQTVVGAGPAAGLDFTLYRGTIPNQLNDEVLLYIQGGQYLVSTDGGDTFSAAADIPTSDTALIGGLSLRFTDGPGASFEDGDSFSFRVEQPNASVNVLTPDEKAWQPDAGAQSVTIDLGSDTAINSVGLLRYSIAAGRQITLELLDDLDATLYSAPIFVTDGNNDPLYHSLGGVTTARKLRLSVDDGEDALFAWAWAGELLQLSVDASSQQLTRERVMARASGPNAPALPLGLGHGARVDWSYNNATPGPLLASDDLAIRGLYDYLANAGDGWLGYIPNVVKSKAQLCLWREDSLRIDDDLAYNADGDQTEYRQVSIQLSGVLT